MLMHFCHSRKKQCCSTYLVQKALKNVKQTQLDFNQNSTFLIKIRWSGLEQIDNGSIKTMIKLRN